MFLSIIFSYVFYYFSKNKLNLFLIYKFNSFSIFPITVIHTGLLFFGFDWKGNSVVQYLGFENINIPSVLVFFIILGYFKLSSLYEEKNIQLFFSEKRNDLKDEEVQLYKKWLSISQEEKKLLLIELANKK